FELDLNLGEGTFHINALSRRYVTNRIYDRWLCAATFFVAGAPRERGIATLRPRLAACTVVAALDGAKESKIPANKLQRKIPPPLLESVLDVAFRRRESVSRSPGLPWEGGACAVSAGRRKCSGRDRSRFDRDAGVESRAPAVGHDGTPAIRHDGATAATFEPGSPHSANSRSADRDLSIGTLGVARTAGSTWPLDPVSLYRCLRGVQRQRPRGQPAPRVGLHHEFQPDHHPAGQPPVIQLECGLFILRGTVRGGYAAQRGVPISKLHRERV